MSSPKPSPRQRLLKPKEAHDYLAVSARSLWLLGNTGEIPQVRFGSCHRQSVRYDLADLDAWIEKKKGGRR
jgi:predicted DNA-binding transcriptional regulator AlpA